MPSTPREDSPFLASAVQRATGPRDPGTPSTAGKPGVQAGRTSFPAPPGVNTGAPGRPGAAPSPAPGAFPAPPSSAPASPTPSGAGGTSRPAPGPAGMPAAAPARPAQPAAGASTGQPPAPPAPGAPATPQAVDAFGTPTGVPTAAAPPPPGTMMPGAQIQTPQGTVTRDPMTGEQKMTLSPEGQQRYKEQKVALREKLGPMPKIFQTMPGLPEFPVELGGWNFNPFTGRMERG